MPKFPLFCPKFAYVLYLSVLLQTTTKNSCFLALSLKKYILTRKVIMLNDDIQDFIRTIGGKMNQYVFVLIEQKCAKRAILCRPVYTVVCRPTSTPGTRVVQHRKKSPFFFLRT